MIHTAAHKAFAYRAIKSPDFFCHGITQPIYKSAKWWKMTYFNITGATMAASLDIDGDKLRER